jgi:hypothetical protein
MTKRIVSAVLATLVVLSVAVAFPRGQAAAVVGENRVTAGGSGVFPAGASFNGIELAGGTFGIGSQTASDGSAVGVVEIQLNGTSLIGLSQWITITGWITTGTLNADGTITLHGTGTLDMGDGTAPSGGLPFVANVSLSGVQVTIGSTTVPTLPKSDGWISIE